MRSRAELSMLALFGILGQIVLLSSAYLLPAVSEYTLIGDTISELVLGQFGFIQTAAFIIGGIGTFALAFAIRKMTEGARGSLLGSLLVGVYGAGAILIAFFPTDRVESQADIFTQSPTGMLHLAIALVSFIMMILGMWVNTWTFRRAPGWQPLVLPSGILAGTAFVLFILQGGSAAGLLQRALVSVIALWMILVAVRIRMLVLADRPGSAVAG